VRASSMPAQIWDHANDQLVVMPMIETAEALKNLDEILSTPGVTGFTLGRATSAWLWAASPVSTRRTLRWWKPSRRSWRHAGVTAWSQGSTTRRRVRAQDDRGRLSVRDVLATAALWPRGPPRRFPPSGSRRLAAGSRLLKRE